MGISLPALWDQGFQTSIATLTPDSEVRYKGRSGALNVLNTVLVVNSPQLAVSFIYLFYNSILTRQLVADEWTRFLRPREKKPLRVSSPVGLQRSTYFLSLPFKYSIPLAGIMLALHWIVSQSLFFVRVVVFSPGPDGIRIPAYDRSTMGYSPIAIIFALSAGLILVTGLVVNAALRHYHDVPRRFPEMGHSSAAISAFCQPPRDDIDAYLFPLSIGVVSDETGDRLTFSTDVDLKEPQDGWTFQQPLFNDLRSTKGKSKKCERTQGRNTSLASVGQLWRRVLRALARRRQ